MMKKGTDAKHRDISGIIALILILTAITVSATGTWIIMETIANAPTSTAFAQTELVWPDATINGNIALNIPEENPQENQISE